MFYKIKKIYKYIQIHFLPVKYKYYFILLLTDICSCSKTFLSHRVKRNKKVLTKRSSQNLQVQNGG